jgi:hypothetical protein
MEGIRAKLPTRFTVKSAGLPMSGSVMRTAVTRWVGEGKRPVEIEHRIGLIENNRECN